MILRLGKRPGTKGSQFVLAKCLKGWSDIFLDDQELLKKAQPESYLPRLSTRRLFASTAESASLRLMNLRISKKIYFFKLT